MSSGSLSMGNLFGSLGFHNATPTLAAGAAAPTAVAAPTPTPLPAALATPAVPQAPAVLPAADPTAISNLQANRRAVAQASSTAGRASTILSQFAATRMTGAGARPVGQSGTGDYSKSTLAAG